MQLDIVYAVRQKGSPAVNAELPANLYAWLLPNLDVADEWAQLLSGLRAPIRGEIRLLSDGQAINLYRSPSSRAQIGLVLLREPGELFGKTVRAHLEHVARIRQDQNLIKNIHLEKEFLERRSESLNENEVRRLQLELAFGTPQLKMLVIVEPLTYPYELWARRVEKLREQGVFIHLLTSSPERAQLLSPDIIFAEAPQPEASRASYDLRVIVQKPEHAQQLLTQAEFQAEINHAIKGELSVYDLNKIDLLRIQEILNEKSVGLLEWQTSNS